jgi:hypothetical protein
MDITQVHTAETLMAWYALVGWVTVVAEICLTATVITLTFFYYEYNRGG